MAATVSTLLNRPDLGLRVLAGADSQLGRRIRWVATSELVDPTPYLEGGELLLTTGMAMPRSRPAVSRYVERLIAAEVVALGIGVGVVHESVPKALVDAASRHGLPLLEVDRPTPFIAISKVVSDIQAAEQLRDLTRGFEAQQQLTRAALRDGPAGVVALLAKQLGGWVVHLDAHVEVLNAVPASAAARAASWGQELEQLRDKGPAAMALVDRDGHVFLSALGAAGRVRGFLATGQSSTPSSTDRAVVNVAAALLSVGLTSGGPGDGRATRATVLRLAESARLSVVDLVSLGGAVFAGGQLWVALVAGEVAALESFQVRLEDEGPSHYFAAERAGRLAVLAASKREIARLGPKEGLAVGIGGPVTVDDLWDGLTQAGHALAVASEGGVAWFEDVRRSGLLGVAQPELARGFADALLAPLSAYEQSSKVELRESLRVWLAHHGQYDPAATALGIHRHTLRYRVRKAESLLGFGLDDAARRMELWFALTVQSGQ